MPISFGVKAMMTAFLGKLPLRTTSVPSDAQSNLERTSTICPPMNPTSNATSGGMATIMATFLPSGKAEAGRRKTSAMKNKDAKATPAAFIKTFSILVLTCPSFAFTLRSPTR